MGIDGGGTVSGGADEVVREALTQLCALPGVGRVGLGLSEGEGRRLRFVSSDRVGDGALDWCLIDAYDDVPLTTVLRTGRPVAGSLDDLHGRYADLVEHQRALGTRALAALPLRSGSMSVGGVIFYFEEERALDDEALLGLESLCQRVADALRRVRPAADPASVAGPDAGPGAGDGDGPAGAHRAALDLDADPRAAGEARRFLRGRLEEWGVGDDAVDSAQLCLSELVNNVIMHAGTTSRLTVGLEDGRLWVMLRDLGGAAGDGTTTSHQPVEDNDEFRVFGRGLTLVDALSDDWGSERDAVGTTAWFAFRVDRDDDDLRAG